jgi:hypothetical protein
MKKLFAFGNPKSGICFRLFALLSFDFQLRDFVSTGRSKILFYLFPRSVSMTEFATEGFSPPTAFLRSRMLTLFWLLVSPAASCCLFILRSECSICVLGLLCAPLIRSTNRFCSRRPHFVVTAQIEFSLACGDKSTAISCSVVPPVVFYAPIQF